MVPGQNAVALALPSSGLSIRVNDRFRFASLSAARRASSFATAVRSSARYWSNSCCEIAPTSTSGRLRITRSLAFRSSASTIATSARARSRATS